MKQQKEFQKAREELLEKVAARSFANNYLSSLNSDVSVRHIFVNVTRIRSAAAYDMYICHSPLL